MNENNGSLMKMDEEETPCRPNPKRRSTFHRRRSTLQFHSEDGSQNTCEKEQKKDEIIVDRIQNIEANNDNKKRKNDEASFDLKKYIEDLKQERKTWKETLLSRKRQHKIIMKQTTANTQHCEQDLDLSALSETERNFLLIRPNYEHICEKARKLSVIATETTILNDHVMHLHNQCISRAEKKLDDITQRIIKLID